MEPPSEAVRTLTDRIREALDRVTLQADEVEALNLVARAERLYAGGQTPHESYELRRRFLAGYRLLRESEPETLAGLLKLVRSVERACAALGVNPERVGRSDFRLARVLAYSLRASLGLGLLLPLAVLGFLVHVVPYYAIDHLATRYARDEDDVLSTAKFLGALMFFPATWLAVALVAAAMGGPWVGALAALAAPASGLAVLAFREWFGDVWTAARSLVAFIRRRTAYDEIRDGQQEIRDRINALESRLAQAPPG
jgi:hypothetical protein